MLPGLNLDHAHSMAGSVVLAPCMCFQVMKQLVGYFGICKVSEALTDSTVPESEAGMLSHLVAP